MAIRVITLFFLVFLSLTTFCFMRDGLIKEIRARAKKEKKHEMDVWIDILYDKKFRATNGGAKVVLQLCEVVFHQKPPTTKPWTPPEPGSGEDEPELGGPPNLRPMKPDPAKWRERNRDKEQG